MHLAEQGHQQGCLSGPGRTDNKIDALLLEYKIAVNTQDKVAPLARIDWCQSVRIVGAASPSEGGIANSNVVLPGLSSMPCWILSARVRVEELGLE